MEIAYLIAGAVILLVGILVGAALTIDKEKK